MRISGRHLSPLILTIIAVKDVLSTFCLQERSLGPGYCQGGKSDPKRMADRPPKGQGPKGRIRDSCPGLFGMRSQGLKSNLNRCHSLGLAAGDGGVSQGGRISHPGSVSEAFLEPI